MLSSKINVLKPLIESNQGQHLTVYLTNDKNIFAIRCQLQEVIDKAYEYLAPVMHPDALMRFLAPLHNLIADECRMLQGFKGNIGIFRNENSFRLLSLPVKVEKTFVVASSFHVKPLLRWLQFDRDFLILHISEGSAVILQGNQISFSLVDKIFVSDLKDKSVIRNEKKIKSFISQINEWLLNFTKNSGMRLFVAGPDNLTKLFFKTYPIKGTPVLLRLPSSSKDEQAELVAQARIISKTDSKQEFQQALLEFYHADYLSLVNRSIFQIAKAAIEGKVKKLIIAEEINIFGKIDKKSGELAIHAEHLDHEDDDLLDDLAQEVLAQGGEVIVASQNEIPMRRAILAIFTTDTSQLSVRKQLPSYGQRQDLGSLI